jgi:transcriptional regulator with XRE-family HTH domain
MTEVIDLSERRERRTFLQAGFGAEASLSGPELQRLRNEDGIHQRQLAAQLNVSVETINRWEKSDVVPISALKLDEALTYIRLHDLKFEMGRNLCFGRFPLRYARDVLNLTQAEMAMRHGYSLSMWRKIESHERSVPPSVLASIENEIRSIVVGTACDGS